LHRIHDSSIQSSAAEACNSAVSMVASGLHASLMSIPISVQPRITACAPWLCCSAIRTTKAAHDGVVFLREARAQQRSVPIAGAPQRRARGVGDLQQRLSGSGGDAVGFPVHGVCQNA
jgi:hypothetical protein